MTQVSQLSQGSGSSQDSPLAQKARAYLQQIETEIIKEQQEYVLPKTQENAAPVLELSPEDKNTWDDLQMKFTQLTLKAKTAPHKSRAEGFSSAHYQQKQSAMPAVGQIPQEDALFPPRQQQQQQSVNLADINLEKEIQKDAQGRSPRSSPTSRVK